VRSKKRAPLEEKNLSWGEEKRGNLKETPPLRGKRNWGPSPIPTKVNRTPNGPKFREEHLKKGAQK